MKRIIIGVVLLSFSCAIYAQSAKVKQVIKKYDVKKFMSQIYSPDPVLFWQAVHDNNKRVKEISKAMEKGEKTMNETALVVKVATDYNNDHDKTVAGLDSIAIMLAEDLGIKNLVKEHPIRFIDDFSINASMDAFGLIRINYGAVRNFTYRELLAVCAHEVAHYASWHVLSGVWKKAKKQKRNRMWADIGAGLFIGAAAATSAYNASVNGYEDKAMNEMIANADVIMQGSYNYADNATEKYSYRYSRDEESEADIIAFRFLEFIGISGDSMISALKKIREMYGDTPAGKYDDHPSLSFRIEVLEAMSNGYSGKTK